jgi:hypothetical protein
MSLAQYAYAAQYEMIDVLAMPQQTVDRAYLTGGLEQTLRFR